MKHKNMIKFHKQAKRVADLKWQIARWEHSYNTYLNKKYLNRVRYYTAQYEVALKRLKTM